jgi:LemA protein
LQISPGVVAAAIVGLLFLWLIAVFNRLVRSRTRVRTAWSDIDVQLKLRSDLVPNLVESVRGYMAHERETLEAVTRARTQALSAGANVPARAAAEFLLAGAIGNLFAVAERYPALRAVESVLLLQEQLTSTENRIAYARQFYDDEVMKYNSWLSTFPHNLIARGLGFAPAAMFAAQEADRVSPQVKL